VELQSVPIMDSENRGFAYADKKRPLGTKPLQRLGARELEVLQVLWSCGAATVQQVSDQLRSNLAYTTVMTTLDRLYKKGALRREKQERAFVYQPAVTPSDLERHRASTFIKTFFGSSASHDLLISCLVDAVQHYDHDLLQQLESKIRVARQNGATSAQRSQEQL
jgi:predicted transcriptional regulator